MNKLNKNVKDNLNLVWLIVTVVCVLITYYCMKAKATNNYKQILQVATKNCSSEIVRSLAKNIININDISFSGLTILGYTSSVGCLEIVKFLIDEGANIHASGWYGWTPLHHAADKGHLEIVKFLLEKGANPNIRANDGRNPRDVAVIESRHNNKDKPYNEVISLLYNAEKQYKSE